ncbi:hypothetical protein MAUB1S_11475 [Mycolicibacterium aubagnense]
MSIEGARAVDKLPLPAVDYMFGYSNVGGQRIGPRPIGMPAVAQQLASIMPLGAVKSYASVAAMNADVTPAAGTLAYAEGKTYRKTASGSPGWDVFLDFIPGTQIVNASISGGTANAPVATSASPVSATPYKQIIILGPFSGPNSGPMTVTINSVTRALVTNNGDPVPPNYVSAKMSAQVVIDADGKLRMYSYGDATAIQAAAEAAASAALTYKNAAEAAAGSVLNPVSYGVAQSLTTPQKQQARVNIDAQKLITSLTGAEKAAALNALGVYPGLFPPVSPIQVSMHFGTLCGTGFIPTDPGGVVASNTTGSVAAAAYAIPVIDGTLFKAGQLINYLSNANNEYYSTVVRSISGNTLNISRPIVGGIASNSPVRNFYTDTTPHPNEFGYYTLCDDALRQIQFKSELVYRSVDSRDWLGTGGGTLTTDTTPAYGNPGSSDAKMSGVNVAVAASGAGAKSRAVDLDGGFYVTRIPFNAGTTTNMAVELGLTLPNGATSAVGYYGAGTTPGAIDEAEFYYRAPPGSRVWAFAHATAAGSANFWLGQIVHRKIKQRSVAPDRGTHILFGDSWFASGHFYNRLVARLPNATIINKGGFGNTAADLLARISTDVLNLKPDFVWLLCGTNDYNNGLSAAYQDTMNKILTQLIAAGIQVFLFDPSVGTSIQLDPSRKLTLGTTLEDAVGGGGVRRTALSIGVPSLASGSSAIIGVLPGGIVRPAKIRFARVSGTGTDLIRFYWGATVNDTSGSIALGLNGGSSYFDLEIPKADRNNSYLTAICYNSAGSAQAVGVAMEIEWYPSTTG